MLLRNFRFADVFLGAPQICFEPDGGDGSGAGGSEGGTAVADDDDSGEDEKKFSQKDLDKLLQDRLARANKETKQELKKKEQAHAELLKKLEALEAKFAGLGGKDDTAGDDGNLDLKTIQGRLEKQKERHDLELAQLKAKVEEAEKGRLAAIEKQRLVERDTEIRQALLAAGCLPTAMVAAERYFIPSVVWDEDDNAWLFKTSGDNSLTIAEGIAAELPPYFRAATITNGGSGSTSSKDRKRVELQNTIKEEEAKLARMDKLVTASGNDPYAIADARNQRMKVKQLQAELAKRQ